MKRNKVVCFRFYAMEVKDLQVPSGVVCVRCGDNRCVPCNIHLGDGYVVKNRWFCPYCHSVFCL